MSEWLKVPVDSINIESELSTGVIDLINQKKFSAEDVKYIKSISFDVTKDKLNISKESLENLRRMCQLWDVDLHPVNVTSHRKFVGFFIVTIKKALFPILKFFLKDFIRQQRAFNAACIAAISDSKNKDD